MSNLDNAITTMIADVDQYYDFSFRITPEKCTPIVLLLIGHIEEAFPALTKQQTTKLNQVLLKIVEALEKKDYVRLRDNLHYDLRELLLSFQCRKGDKRYQ